MAKVEKFTSMKAMKMHEKSESPSMMKSEKKSGEKNVVSKPAKKTVKKSGK